MAMNLKSSSWYRVAALKPLLRSHARIHRHSFRGQRWYVIQDQASGKHHRFSPAAHLVISLMDGNRTVEEIWFFLQGHGQVWRKFKDSETIAEVQPGVSLTIATGAHFQFRNTGEEPLTFVITTMPPWPGDEEAVRVADHWPVV